MPNSGTPITERKALSRRGDLVVGRSWESRASVGHSQEHVGDPERLNAMASGHAMPASRNAR